MVGYGSLSKVLEESIRNACEGKHVGIAFSGGLDSGLVAAVASRYAESVTCYTCGTENAFDVKAGMELAEKLGLPWVHCKIGKGNIESLIRELFSSTGVTDPFTISYELQLFTVCKTAKEATIISGQGSDEYFGGCAKLVDQSESDYMMLLNAGVERLWKVSIPCEQAIAKSFGKELLYPYLTDEVIAEVGTIDPALIRPSSLESRKVVLRETAVDMGFPILENRTKKASQYGSGTTDLIRGMARSQGKFFNQYVTDICEDVFTGGPLKIRGSVINARVDPIVKVKAEEILSSQGLTPSECIEAVYRRIIDAGRFD